MSRFANAFSRAIPSSRNSSRPPSGSDSDSDSDLEPEDLSSDAAHEKYRLRVTAGPSYDYTKHRLIFVNTEDPTAFENEFMRVKVKVRVQDYTGLPRHSPTTSAYFSDPDRKKDQYSLSFSFIPKVNIPSVDTVWGNDFDTPIRDRLPPGFNTAFRFVRHFVDPGLECDPKAQKPWLLGPSLSCWFKFRIGEMGPTRDPQLDDVVREGADGDGKDVRSEKRIPEGSEKRRKFFLDVAHRQDFAFEQGRRYQVDFHNPYIDFNKMSLKLPGITIQVAKYIGTKTHRLRYVFKNKTTGDVYFVVVFNLLYGEELQQALREDKSTEIARVKHEEDFGGVD